MHPAHIPLIAEIKPAVFRRSGHHRPCGGFLRDHHGSVVSACDQCVDMAEELNRLQIFVARQTGLAPTVPAAFHSPDTAWMPPHPHAVHPHDNARSRAERFAIRKFLTSCLAIIKNLCSPLRMLAFSRIRILIKRFAVKVRQTVRISRKMRRNPVQDDTDLVFVQIIDQST